MGREQKRKEAKKNGIKVSDIKKEQEVRYSMETKTGLKIILVVISLIVIIYLIMAIFVTKELDLSTKKEEETSEESSNSVSNAILASATFKQSDENYYVLFYGFDNEDDNDIVSSVSSKLTDYKVYKVDTDSGLNKNYVSDESNPNVTSIDNLKVKDPTLILISADSVTQYIEGISNIETYLEG